MGNEVSSENILENLGFPATSLVGDASLWRVVITESDLRLAMHRGFIAPTYVLRQGEALPNLGRGLQLVRQQMIAVQAQTVRNDDSEIGRPVSIIWNPRYLRTVLPETHADALAAVVHRALPLVPAVCQIAFSESGRLSVLKSFLEDEGLTSHLISKEIIDFNLGMQRPPYGLSSPLNESRNLSSKKLSELQPSFYDQDEQSNSIGSTQAAFDSDPGSCEKRHEISALSETAISLLEREERIQCGVELAFDVAETPSQLQFAACLADKSVSRDGLADEFYALCGFRHQENVKESSLVQEAARFILSRPELRISSAMSIEEKLELVAEIQLSKVSDAEKKELEKLRINLVSDVSLSSPKISKSSLALQGLVLFLLHSESPLSVTGIDVSYYEFEEAARSLCAFLVGLRFNRSLYRTGCAFMPLRDRHVWKAIGALHESDEFPQLENVIFNEGQIHFGTVQFLPMRRGLLLELNAVMCIAEGRGGTSEKFKVSKIIVESSDRPTIGFNKLPIWKTRLDQRVVEDVLHSLEIRTSVKKGETPHYLFGVFANKRGIVDQHIEEVDVVTMKFKSPVQIVDNEGRNTRREQVKIVIRRSAIVEHLKLNSHYPDEQGRRTLGGDRRKSAQIQDQDVNLTRDGKQSKFEKALNVQIRKQLLSGLVPRRLRA